MEFITRPIENRLWPRGSRSSAPTPLWLTGARFSYALLRDFMHGDLTLRAMSLVYTTMLAIVPLLAFVFSALKGLGVHRDLEPMLRGFLAPLGPRSGELSGRIIEFVDNISGSALASVGIVLLVYTALSMAQKVESSFNFVWRVDHPRSLARRVGEYLSFMLLGPVVMSVAMGLTATFASILWAGGGSLFTGFVVSASRYEAIYAGFAIVIVAMIWLYLSWLILLLGAQLAFYVQQPEYLPLGQRALSASNATRERLALSVMLLVGQDYENPGHGWRIESLAARVRVPRHLLDPVVTALMEEGLLMRTIENRLIPARDLRRITVIDILAAVRSSARDPHHQADDDWNPTVTMVAEEVERAIRDSLRDRTLADLVDSDSRSAPVPT
jgi:membrane protein